MYGIAMRYGKGFKTSFFTVILVIGLGFVFSLMSHRPSSQSYVSFPQYSHKQVKILQRYLDCKPYIGYENMYKVWRYEAHMAFEMNIVVAPVYRAKNIATSIAPRVGLPPDDKDLIAFANIIVMREDLISWYGKHVEQKSVRLFQKTHVGYLRWNEGNGCLDYSFLPIYALPYHLRNIDIEATWGKARQMGLTITGYVDGIYIEKVLYGH